MAVRLTLPVTIVTGFLGSGKTTLINRLLAESHDGRIAVIENEFGAVGVDADLLTRTGAETIIQLANGCLCCTVRGDLAKGLQQVAEEARRRGLRYERVVIETTGLADPGPVIQTFLAETAIEALFHLDGVVTVVDALHARDQWTRPEFEAQIGYADRLLLSKADLAGSDRLDACRVALSRLNPRAPVLAVDLPVAPIADLLAQVVEVRGFASDYLPAEEVRRALSSRTTGVRSGLGLESGAKGTVAGETDGELAAGTHNGTDNGVDSDARSESGARHRNRAAAHGLRPIAAARHSRGVRSVVFQTDSPLDLERLNAALDALVAHYGPSLWRCKGVVFARGHRGRLIVQGVQSLIQIGRGMMWRPFEARQTVLVFIGQSLDPEWITARLRA